MRRTMGWVVFWLAAAERTLAGADDWPRVEAVDVQPLRAQTARLAEALELVGQPLAAESAGKLAALALDDPTQFTAQVQDLLDPHCLAAVRVGSDGVGEVVPRPGPLPLVEQGWRAYLVKVVNSAGSTGQLRVESRQARPVANSPAADVADLWLSLAPYTGQPLTANLSGLALEYTVVQVYSRDAGPRQAEIAWRIEGGAGPASGPGPLIRDWRFATDAAGWRAENQVTLEARQGSLHLTMTGEDPFLAADVSSQPGELILRFWADFSQGGVGQVFWWTSHRPQPDGAHQVNFQFDGDGGREYEIRFTAEDELAGVRIDPGGLPGTARFDWITLGYERDPLRSQARASFHFAAAPSHPVTFDVRESDGTPTTAAFLIRDVQRRVYPAQSKRLAPDFFFQPQVYRASGETVRLPAGEYSVACSRGPESIPETQSLVVANQPTTCRYQVRRWIDPARRGWYSGDHHIHAAGCLHYESPTEGVEPRDMLRHLLGEDLKIGCCLTWGPCFDYQKRFFRGQPDPVSQPPYLLRYDVEVSGFGSHVSGHLNLLNLREQIPPGGHSKHHWPTLGMNTLRWAKRQGAICGPAHSGSGLTQFVGRVAGAADGPRGLPHYQIPSYDGIGANEFVVQVTHQVPGPEGKEVPAIDFISTMNTDRIAEWTMWYHVLNCGFRVRASGETDFPCMSGDRVGIGRVYVQVDGPLDFASWVGGLAAGRSYVSDGTAHLLDLTASAEGRTISLGTSGSEVHLAAPGVVRLTLAAAARREDSAPVTIEVVRDGLPVAQQSLPSDGELRELPFDVPVEASGWLAVRTFPSAHTNPFFVLVDHRPPRPQADSVAWCLAGVDQCWKSKVASYHPDERAQAEADYEHARTTYRRLLEAAGAGSSP